MTKVRRAFGAWGEQVAATHLEADGITVIERNWRCRAGEIDIIGLERETIVFCEVKTRRSLAFGAGVEAVLGAKARRLRRLAATWLSECGRHGHEVRFDVITIMPSEGRPHVDHVRGAF
jgi:putative endonuclease